MVSLLLIAAGAALVAVALFNRVPRIARAHRNGAPPRPRILTAPARLTELGRATLVTVGGTLLIAAFFLALSGL